MDWLYENIPITLRALLTTVLLYIILIAYVRFNGLRSFAKISSTDFVVTILIGNVLGTSIMYNNQSIWKSVLVIGLLLLIQNIFSRLKRNYPLFDTVARNKPMVLMKNGMLIEENLKKALISKDDLRYKLREAGVTKLKDIKYVIFETTGDISVLKNTGEEIDNFLLEDLDDGKEN